MHQGLTFAEALAACRAGTVFTTHTPVSAGIDRFAREMIESQFGRDVEDPALPCPRVLALGAETWPGGDPDVFNMAVMGMRLAQRVNGVSRLHGQVSREMFTGLWPGFDSSRGADRLGDERRARARPGSRPRSWSWPPSRQAARAGRARSRRS